MPTTWTPLPKGIDYTWDDMIMSWDEAGYLTWLGTSSFNNLSKSLSTWIPQTKVVDYTWEDMVMTWDEADWLTWAGLSSFNPLAKNISAWDLGLYFLLQEIGAYLLQENGGKMILEESHDYKKQTVWTNEPKL